MEKEPIKLKNATKTPVESVETAEKLTPTHIEPSSAPQCETSEEKKMLATPVAEKNSVSSGVALVTVPNNVPRTAPAQVPTEAVPVERKVHSVPAAVTPAIPGPEASTPPAQPDITEPEKNIPKKAVTTAEFIGTWKGQFTNAYGKTAATLTVRKRGKRPYCVFTFYPLRENLDAGSGQFEMNISLNEETGDCELRGVRWIKNPKRRALMPLRGKISGNEFLGKIFADIPTPNDWTFMLEKKVQ